MSKSVDSFIYILLFICTFAIGYNYLESKANRQELKSTKVDTVYLELRVPGNLDLDARRMLKERIDSYFTSARGHHQITCEMTGEFLKQIVDCK